MSATGTRDGFSLPTVDFGSNDIRSQECQKYDHDEFVVCGYLLEGTNAHVHGRTQHSVQVFIFAGLARLQQRPVIPTNMSTISWNSMSFSRNQCGI